MRQAWSLGAEKSYNVFQEGPIPCHLVSSPPKVEYFVGAPRASWKVFIFEVVGRPDAGK